MNPIDGQSIEERLKARLALKQAQHETTLPVDGYEDLFAARYRAISYEEMRGIARRNERIADEDEREVATAADVLAIACEEVFAVEPDGEHTSLGAAWSPQLAQTLGLPPVTTARQCLLALFPDHMDLVSHQTAYLIWRDRATVKAAEETVGKLAS
jgi:hypothetical protein